LAGPVWDKVPGNEHAVMVWTYIEHWRPTSWLASVSEADLPVKG
jgi:hypothetical protein